MSARLFKVMQTRVPVYFKSTTAQQVPKTGDAAASWDPTSLPLIMKKPVVEAPKTQPNQMERKARHSKFEVLSNTDIKMFEDLIGAENVLADTDGFVVDVTKKFSGVGSIVLTPTTTE